MADKKTVKFHGQQVQNVVVRYTQIGGASATLEEFDAAKDPEACKTVNVQVVSEFVTITFYRDEKTNSIVRRLLIPTHRVERMEVKDLQGP
jgi:hypothetical protein